MAFQADGDLLCGSNESGEVVLWDAETGALLRRGETPATHLTCVAALPDGPALTADGDGVVRLWTPRSP